VKEGNGYTKEYDEITQCFVEGKYDGGMKKGEWKGKHKNINFTFAEFYKADTLVSGESTDSVGNKHQYIQVQETAEYIGGMDELRKFLAQNIKYPAFEREKSIQAKVFIQFIIDKNGEVTQVSVKRWGHPGLDQEAVRVVSNMPKWKPGIVRGIPVRYRYVLPINFKIN